MPTRIRHSSSCAGPDAVAAGTSDPNRPAAESRRRLCTPDYVAMTTIGSVVGCGEPPAGSTVIPTATPGVNVPSSTRHVSAPDTSNVPARAAPASPGGHAPVEPPPRLGSGHVERARRRRARIVDVPELVGLVVGELGKPL